MKIYQHILTKNALADAVQRFKVHTCKSMLYLIVLFHNTDTYEVLYVYSY